MLMNAACCSSTLRRESCLMKVWVFGTGKTCTYVLCPVWAEHVYSQLIHTNCSSGYKAIAVREENFWGWSSSENSHRSLCVITGLLVVCFHANRAFHEIPWFSGQCCTLLSLQYIEHFSLPGRWMHKSMITTAHNPFLTHSRICSPSIGPANSIKLKERTPELCLQTPQHLHPLTL